jgi:hypothetical protein
LKIVCISSVERFRCFLSPSLGLCTCQSERFKHFKWQLTHLICPFMWPVRCSLLTAGHSPDTGVLCSLFGQMPEWRGSHDGRCVLVGWG